MLVVTVAASRSAASLKEKPVSQFGNLHLRTDLFACQADAASSCLHNHVKRKRRQCRTVLPTFTKTILSGSFSPEHL